MPRARIQACDNSGMKSDAIVSIRDASFTYNGTPALTGVSFDVYPGEAVALIGPNGAGKSTLLAGILGTVKHRAERFVVPSVKGGVGLLPQHQAVDRDFPVSLEQVVTMGRIARRGVLWPSKDDRHAVRDALATVGLTEQRRKRFGDLSGGQRQRGFLARALAAEPKLLLLDEPFNGLDTASREQLLEIVRRLKRSGVAMIITTHDLDLARAVTEKTLLINGEQIAFDATDCVLTLEKVQQTFDSHAMEIDGHTLATTEHHASEHPHHDHKPSQPRTDAE